MSEEKRPRGRPPAENPKSANMSFVRIAPDELEYIRKGYEVEQRETPDLSFAQWCRNHLTAISTRLQARK